MNIETIIQNGINIAVISGGGQLIADAGSALDMMMTVKYTTNAQAIVISKAAVTEDFFRLGTGLAGEVLQKFINYHMKLAIWGDFSGYTSKPLRDFIRESNRGRDIFFAGSVEDAVSRLARSS